MYHFAVQMHYNRNNGSTTLVFVGWMYVMGVVHDQRVRLYYFARTRARVCVWSHLKVLLIGVWKRYEVVILHIVLSK